MYLFKIFQAVGTSTCVLPSKIASLLKDKKDLLAYALTINIMLKLLKQKYQIRKAKIENEYIPLPRDKWKNDYPIILVHGFGGFIADES